MLKVDVFRKIIGERRWSWEVSLRAVPSIPFPSKTPPRQLIASVSASPPFPKASRSFAEALTLSSFPLIILSSQGQNSIDYMDTFIPVLFFYPVAD